eukprot:TRINITY_DN2565_c0_g1_i1.p3 TRINITY_DN2565_c0_g1~~TRINITY_DN2565_c0_g1_i1.p3  ORF type:complete len:58 (+),score=9.30 TRINITY_DN2565_c0_g1_i1:265-438(+)
MGQEISHISPQYIPDYFVERVPVDEARIGLLEKSLDTIIYGLDADKETDRLAFLKFL